MGRSVRTKRAAGCLAGLEGPQKKARRERRADKPGLRARLAQAPLREEKRGAVACPNPM
ncbi:hypothetical protein GCM10023090_19540 [Acidovorax lacteus]|uniref:Uncharacterized protein n=1 Tax=Acidovorax lacteus TaxID=1924988 RepID=A0ABP8L8Y2_9BURK